MAEDFERLLVTYHYTKFGMASRTGMLTDLSPHLPWDVDQQTYQRQTVYNRSIAKLQRYRVLNGEQRYAERCHEQSLTVLRLH